jgi:hypothetical protein
MIWKEQKGRQHNIVPSIDTSAFLRRHEHRLRIRNLFTAPNTPSSGTFSTPDWKVEKVMVYRREWEWIQVRKSTAYMV